MLPKSQRLTNTRDFKRVYQKGSFFSASFFSFNWSKSKFPQTKVGVVITKKTAAKATDRNKIKRKFRALAQKYYNQIPPGFDLIIVIKPKAKEADFAELEKDFAWAIKKIGYEKNRNRHN